MNENMIFNLGGSGGAALNFKVVPNPQPSNPKENTIWVNTDTKIPVWHFGAEEPNVYDIKPISASDPHNLICPHKLSMGDVLNFTITNAVTSLYEYLRISDGYKTYYIRGSVGEVLSMWQAGVKVCIKICNINGSEVASVQAWDYKHEEGKVWFPVGTSSPVAFNALKKNAIQVYPISAKQYVGGAWVDKEAKSYQGGAWVAWAKFLYKDGTEYTELTGGWTTFDYTAFNGTPISERLATFDYDHIWFENTTTYQSCNIRSQKMIDLTPFSKLCVEVSIQAGKYFDVIVTSTTSAEVSANVGIAQLRVGTAGDYTLQLDISSVAQSAYVVISTLRGEGGDANGRASVKRIWLT